jgi:hypothetical protein
VPESRSTRTALELRNHSRIVCLPGDAITTRCYSDVSRITVDEAAMTEDALYAALLPMLSMSKGKLMLISTPMGRRGFFFNEFTSDDPSWFRLSVPATECPRFPPEVLAEQRRLLGQRWFDQEFNACFVEAIDQVFPTDQVNRCFVGAEGVPVLPGF